MLEQIRPYHNPEVIPESRKSERVERMLLDANKPTEIDTTKVMADASFLEKEIGVDGALVASVRAGETDFLLIDTRNSHKYFTPFLVISDDYEYGAPNGWKGVYPHTPVVIGRAHHKNRFPTDSMMSRDHFSILYDEESDRLLVKDEASMNGTYLTGFTPDVNKAYVKKDIYDEFTVQALEDLERERNYGEKDSEAPHGRYRNHPIIGRRSRTVRNGVYGTRSSEFILVDDKSTLMKNIVDDFMATLPSHEEAATLNAEIILKKISFRVANILRYDLNETERISSPHYDHKGLIDLSEYVEAGVGVCRHQSLLAAHLIEEVIDKGYLAGQVGVERNYDREANGAHAWAVFKSETSGDMIVDPANHFVGSRRKAQDEGRWRYVVADDEDKR